MRCTICHKEIADGRDYRIKPPVGHVYSGWCAQIVVCYPCQQEHYSKLMDKANAGKD